MFQSMLWQTKQQKELQKMVGKSLKVRTLKPRENARVADDERMLLSKLYKKGAAAFGGVQTLQQESGLSKAKVSHFLHGKQRLQSIVLHVDTLHD